MCTELVPILHTRENFVPDLHMYDKYLTNSSHIRSVCCCNIYHIHESNIYAERQCRGKL